MQELLSSLCSLRISNMANLKSIKRRILSYRKTGAVTHAMEAVSAVKMRKSQERALSGRAYAAAGLSILERLAGTSDLEKHYLTKSAGGKTCFVVVTSDKGLAGALNSGVVRLTEREAQKRGLAVGDVQVIAVGRRAAEHFASRGYSMLARHINLSDGVSETDALDISSGLSAGKKAGMLGLCFVVYQNFISTFEQHPTIRQIIPITPEGVREMVKGIRPAKGKYAPRPDDTETPGPDVYTIEPDPESVLETLLPKLLNLAVFHALLEAKASEHSARMVAMKNATDKAGEMVHSLTRVFNKVRQAAITREVSEITSGIEAMK